MVLEPDRIGNTAPVPRSAARITRPMLLVFCLLCLESTLFLAFATGRLETGAFVNLHLAVCAATATFGFWWVGATSTAAVADDKIAAVLQSVAWTVLAGPFGTVVAAALLVPRKAGASHTEAAASRPGLARLELLHGSLLDSRMRLEHAHAIRPLLDVIIEGRQLEKFDALSLISKRYDPALAPALRRALEDKDASVRVLAATGTWRNRTIPTPSGSVRCRPSPEPRPEPRAIGANSGRRISTTLSAVCSRRRGSRSR